MADDPRHAEDAVHQPTIGGFRFWYVGQRWEWSDEVARMHGYEPGQVQPTTDLLLSHKHPDDRRHVQDALDHALRDGAAFSSRHRLIDTAGNEHTVVVVADRMFDDEGNLVGTEGYYVDVTEALDDTRRDIINITLPELVDARAEIEQAKGVLMFVYRISAEQAFGLLRWRSQETNTKLRTLAAAMLAEMGSLGPLESGVQSEFDHLLLTLHRRLPGQP